MIGVATPSVLLGDMDADGDIDMLVLGSFSPAVGLMGGAYNIVFLNDGSGIFAKDLGSDLAFEGSIAVAYGDINSDGLLDYVLSGASGVRVLLAKRTPSIAISSTTSNALTAAIFADSGGAPSNRVKGVDVALGDLDADGDLDLVLVRYVDTAPQVETEQTPIAQFRASVMRNTDGDGTFVEASKIENVISVSSTAATTLARLVETLPLLDDSSDALTVQLVGPSGVTVVSATTQALADEIRLTRAGATSAVLIRLDAVRNVSVFLREGPSGLWGDLPEPLTRIELPLQAAWEAGANFGLSYNVSVSTSEP